LRMLKPALTGFTPFTIIYRDSGFRFTQRIRDDAANFACIDHFMNRFFCGFAVYPQLERVCVIINAIKADCKPQKPNVLPFLIARYSNIEILTSTINSLLLGCSSLSVLADDLLQK
jgi:hypothetical protein